MQGLKFSPFALSITAAAVLLSACGGGSLVPVATNSATVDANAHKHSQTFDYTGKKQTFIVPARVRQLTVVAHGGQGAPGGYAYAQPPCYHPCDDFKPGFPGRVYAIIPVHPGEKLYVFVGASGRDGGFNGGGPGGMPGYGSEKGPGGGGASDVRAGGDALNDRILVAAGGGGGGLVNGVYYQYAPGGNGGGLAGESGGSEGYSLGGGGGAGGTQSEGGLGGAGGVGSQSGGDGQAGGSGTLGGGGSGGNGGPGKKYSGGVPGGGGGGGYYGGGGGGGSAAYTYSDYFKAASGGAGGGSSYIEPSAITSRMWTGWRAAGDGRVIFSWK